MIASETRPVNIIINQPHDAEQLRRSIFAGDILLHTDRVATKKIADYAMEVLRDNFQSDEPEVAYLHVPKEDFVAKAARAKTTFTNSTRSKELLKAFAIEMGLDPSDFFFDVPRLRIVPNFEYLHAGVSYAYAPHRDPWYGGPQYQINHWMPVQPIDPGRTMAIFPNYFNRVVKNSSADFDLERWVNVERFKAAENVSKEERVHPLPLEEIDKGAELRLAGDVGNIMIFCGHHLHATIPNETPVTRFSVDFRFFYIRDLQTNGNDAVKAPRNIDCAATSRDFGISSLFSLDDFSPYAANAR
jgi:hypothetical protein